MTAGFVGRSLTSRSPRRSPRVGGDGRGPGIVARERTGIGVVVDAPRSRELGQVDRSPGRCRPYRSRAAHLAARVRVSVSRQGAGHDPRGPERSWSRCRRGARASVNLVEVALVEDDEGRGRRGSATAASSRRRRTHRTERITTSPVSSARVEQGPAWQRQPPGAAVETTRSPARRAKHRSQPASCARPVGDGGEQARSTSLSGPSSTAAVAHRPIVAQRATEGTGGHRVPRAWRDGCR